MKKFLLPLLLLFSASAFAQTALKTATPVYAAFNPMISGATKQCVLNLNIIPVNDHTFVYSFPNGAPSAVTVTVYKSTTGVTPATVVTTGTSTGGGTIHFAASVTGLCFEATSLTGANVTVSATYFGTVAGTNGGTVGIGQVTSHANEVVVLSGGGMTPGTAGTASTQVQSVQGISGMTPIQITSTVVDCAEGAAVCTAPVPVGGVYRVPGSAVTLDDGDIGYPRVDVNGMLFSRGLPAGTLKSGAVTSAMTGTTSTAVIAAQASNYLYVTSCTFSNDHATVGTLELLQDGSGGTTIWKGPNPSAASATNVSGSTINFLPALKVPTLGNALYVANVTTGSSTYASCNGWYSTISF